MKKLIFILLLFPVVLSAQFDISAGMGINISAKSSLRDYINISFGSPENEMKSFVTEVEFFAEADHPVSDKYNLALEYALSIYSYTNSVGMFGIYDFSLVHHKPSLIGYYVLKGEGYKFKFGGGIGLRIAQGTEKIPNTISETVYTAVGLGVLGKFYGMTMLGDNLYAYIGGDIRVDMPGVPESNGIKLHYNAGNEEVNLNSISAGIKLGVVYSF